jgi:hypothetical protein
MEKKKLKSGHECWTLNLRKEENSNSKDFLNLINDKIEEIVCKQNKLPKKEKSNTEILAEQIEDGLSQWTGTMFDSEGNVIPAIECPKGKYVMHIISEDGHQQILMDIPEYETTFNYCPPKKDSNKE